MNRALLAAALIAGSAVSAHAQVAISQIHCNSTIYQFDYVELFNQGSSAVNLAGWSIQFAQANGSFWEVNSLTGSVPAHSFYLIQFAPASGSIPLPTPNDTGSTSMPLFGGKVFLVNDSIPLSSHCPSADRIVDMVLYGNAACSVPTAPELTNNSAIFRLNGGCIDSDDNSLDFFSDFPNPHNTLTSHPCTTAPDCNGNGIDDTTELTSGALTDINGNSTPDACEGAVVIEAPLSVMVRTGGVPSLQDDWRAQGTAVEDENGRMVPSYAAARWSNANFANVFNTRFGVGRWTIRQVSIVLHENSAAPSLPGTIRFYYTNNDAINLTPGTFSTQFGNFAADYPDRQEASTLSYSGGGPGLDFVMGIYLAGQSNPPGALSVANEIHSGAGTLTMVLYPESTTVLADFAGSTNPTWAGPTLVVFAQQACGSADFNCDGDTGTDADIESFFTCLAGTCPPAPCQSNADFNADGDVGTDADIEAFFRVLAGGSC
jgi:hypothetical protein